MDDETRLNPADEAEHRLTVLSPAALSSLGLIAYWAAWTENSLDTVARSCLDLDRAGADVVLRGKTAGALCELIRSLARTDRLRSDARFDGVLDAVEAAWAALQRRNQIVHGAIGGAIGDGDPVTVWRRDWRSSIIVTSAEFDDAARDLHVAFDGLVAYWWLDEAS